MNIFLNLKYSYNIIIIFTLQLTAFFVEFRKKIFNNYFDFLNINTIHINLRYNGFFAGTPAFLGYFLSVSSSFLINTKTLDTSVPGNTNSSTLLIFPPSIFIAFFELLISSSDSPALYEIKKPSSLTNGIQYSDNVDKLATALETQISYFSLYLLSDA